MTHKSSYRFTNKQWLVLGLLMSASFVTASIQSAVAQSTTPPGQTFEDLDNPNRGDIFSNRGGNQSSSMMDIIHRALQGQGRSMEEYSQEQSDNLDAAAEQYRKLQQKQTSGSSQSTPSNVPSTPATPAN